VDGNTTLYPEGAEEYLSKEELLVLIRNLKEQIMILKRLLEDAYSQAQ